MTDVETRKRAAPSKNDGLSARKAIRIDDDVESSSSNEEERRSSAASVDDSLVVNASTITTARSFIEPIAPNPSFVIPSNDQPQRFAIYMAIREAVPSSFSKGLDVCADNCNIVVNQYCLQNPGTRHITMFEGTLTNQQAASLRFTSTEAFAPVKIELDGWKNWKAGLYLSLSKKSEQEIKSLLQKILKTGGKCNHLSLYRKRGINVGKEFDRVRKATEKYNWGAVEGVSIRIKVLGSPYEDCKVLAGVYK